MAKTYVLDAIAAARSEAATTVDPRYDAVVVERSIMFFQELLLKVSKPSYFMHTDFLPAVEEGYGNYVGYEDEYSDFPFADFLHTLEREISRVVYNKDCCAALHLGVPLPSYPQSIGYALGMCAARLESGMVPLLPCAVAHHLAPALRSFFRSLCPDAVLPAPAPVVAPVTTHITYLIPVQVSPAVAYSAL